MYKILKNYKRKLAMDAVIQEPLPYAENALSPYLSSKTLTFHYGKHHKAYIEKTNQLVKGTEFQDLSLKEIILACAGDFEKKTLFNNAAQAWNHGFLWKSMNPDGGGRPGRDVMNLIKNSFGNFEDFKKRFEEEAVSHFGSGWIWLVKVGGNLEILQTHDAENPLISGEMPLLTLDVWEHAYYLDYQNQRAEYVKAFLEHLVDWEFVDSNL